jgi:hypothetical protein
MLLVHLRPLLERMTPRKRKLMQRWRIERAESVGAKIGYRGVVLLWLIGRLLYFRNGN